MSRIDAAAQLISTSPDVIFAALLDPEALAEWLPPDGMRGSFDHFDPRVGGFWRMTLNQLSSP